MGAVERNRVLPVMDSIGAGDVVLGLPSSGIHSNGYSLVRHIVKLNGLDYNMPCPFEHQGNLTLGRALLTPTKIYIRALLPEVKNQTIKGMAHITGGGFIDNIPRVLPDNVQAVIDGSSWPLPPVFQWLQKLGGIAPIELARTFNCGIGMVLIVEASKADAVMAGLKARGEPVFRIGHLAARAEGAEHVIMNNW
eukprot:Colp12_sorted_trinity150504_noHs@15541